MIGGGFVVLGAAGFHVSHCTGGCLRCRWERTSQFIRQWNTCECPRIGPSPSVVDFGKVVDIPVTFYWLHSEHVSVSLAHRFWQDSFSPISDPHRGRGFQPAFGLFAALNVFALIPTRQRIPETKEHTL